MSPANSPISIKINGSTAHTLQPSGKLKLTAKVGERYRPVRRKDETEVLAEGVLATRKGDDLELSYTDGSQLVLESFFPTCQREACAVELPGDKGGAVFLSAEGASATLGSQSETVLYAYGSQAQTTDLLRSRGIEATEVRGLSVSDGVLTYTPPSDHFGTYLLALPLLAVVGSGSGAAATAPTILQGTVVAGPVIAGNGLKAVAYRADGTVLASTAVKSDGTFTLNLGDYQGPALVKVSDSNTEPDYFDEATGAPKDLTTDLRALAVIPGAGIHKVSINVLTELAVRSLGLLGGDDGGSNAAFANLAQSDIVKANQKVALAVGLQQDLVLGAEPVAIITTTGAANAQTNDYGRLLAALSGAEQGSSTAAVLDELAQKLQANATGQVLERLLEGAKVVDLVAAVSDITNQKSTAVTIDTVSQDNRLSPAEAIAGVQVKGSAAPRSNVILTWSDASVAAQATASRSLTVDAQGHWSTTFTASELPALGATTLMAIVGSSLATRSVYVEEPPAPTVALAQTTGAGSLTRDGRVDVGGVLPGASWEYSVDGGASWSTGSGTYFTATADGSTQALARQSIGRLQSPVSNRVSFTLDASAPTAPSLALIIDSGVSSTDGISNGGAVTVGGREHGASWQYSIDNGDTWQSSTGSSFTLPQGSYAAGAVRVRQIDAAGNISPVGSNAAAITIDAAAPTVSLSSNVTQLAAGAAAQINFTLSEAVRDFGVSSISVVGGSLSNFSGSGTRYSATFTPDTGLNGEATVQVMSGTLTDESGNSNPAASNSISFMTDTLSPLVSIMTSSRGQVRIGQNAELTIVLSEASTDFSLADLQAVGGTLSEFSGSGINYTATFTPEANRSEAGGVAVTRASFTDAAGNFSRSGDADGVVLAINTQRPTAVLKPRLTMLGIGDTTNIEITLSEKSSDFTLSDLSPSHGALSDFRAKGDGIHYSVVFTPHAGYTGTGSVALADGSFTNAAGNPNGGAEQAATAIWP
jgi:hypothetical protein